MPGTRRNVSWNRCWAPALFISLLAGCGGGTSSVERQISVTFNGSSSQTVGQGQSITITITVSNDASERGVTWTLTGPGALSKQTTTSVEYDAPPSVPTSTTATITAAAIADTTRTATFTVNLSAIVVSVSPSPVNVLANATQVFTATVQNDASNKGVTWTISPSSGAGTLSNATSTSVTYTAPPNPPATDLMVTITATSVSTSAISGSATVTLPAITIVLAPASAVVQAGSSQVFTATVNNDPSGQGVVWALSPPSGAGTLSKATKTSVTYNAPANVPSSDVPVTITATSVTSPAIATTANVTVPAIMISVDPNSAIVPAGTQQVFTATVNYDPKNQGVIWSISPASGAGTLSNATSTSVTYNAPAATPSNDVAVTITATSVTDPTRASPATATVPAIAISITPTAPTVVASSSQNFTASVTYDQKNAGVTWSISPASGAGTLSNVTTTSVTYNAPANAPSSNLAVTLTATSVTDSSRSAQTTITVPAISVGVSPASVLMPINATQQFTGTVNNDPTSKGVSWTAVQGGTVCSSACGSFAPTATASGVATTYTAPAAVPATPAVSITGTSVTDASKSAISQITITNGTVKLVPGNLDFGSVKHSLSRSLSITLTNTGKSALGISSMALTTHYSETDSCGTSVAAAASCTITVKFTPAGTGVIPGTLTITDTSPDSPQVVALTGTGRAAVVLGTTVANQASVTAPAPSGPNRVGTRVVDLVDPSREDPFLRDGRRRELLVRFWYPADVEGDCTPAQYTSPEVWSYFSQLLGMALPEVLTNSCQDAALSGKAHPVVVFTPGYTGTFTDYTYLFEDLASRGYIVASLNHTYEATAVDLLDGRFAKSAFGSHLGGSARTDEDAYTSAVLVRLADFQFVLNALDRLNVTPKGPFAGHLDMTRLALAGHSLGGLAALAEVEREPRFKAGIILDAPSLDRFAAPTPTATPVLLAIAGREQWSVEECRLWGDLHGSRLGLKLPGADHLAASDAVWLTRGLVKTGNLGPEKTLETLRTYIAGFLDANLRGVAMESLLNAQSPNYPAVVVSTAAESVCGKR